MLYCTLLGLTSSQFDDNRLTHLCRMEFPTVIHLLGGIFHFIQISIEHSSNKQRRPKSDAALCGVWSGSALFAYVTDLYG